MEERQGETVSGGATLAWRELGEGPPLLVINGYAATAADWDPTFLGELAGSAELTCPDNRGVGSAGWTPGERLTVDLIARDALAVLDARGIERTSVLGWSMGGFVAQQLAAIAPERVERLVLLSTDPGGPESTPAEEATWAQLTDHSGTPREQASRLLALLFPPALAPGIDEQFGDLVAEARARLDPRVLTAQESAMAEWHAEPADTRLGAIDVPVLCAAGAEDVVIPAVNSEHLASALPGPGAMIFEGCGHAFMAQEPARLAGAIADFLAG